MLQRTVHIKTFGCQMNERDTEIMEQILYPVGFVPTADIETADLVILNTCSVRAKAEQKVYSLLGRLKKLKERKPSMIITVAGCVAQQEGSRLPDRMKAINDKLENVKHLFFLQTPFHRLDVQYPAEGDTGKGTGPEAEEADPT